MDWILLEKQKPVDSGAYLVCFKTEDGYVASVDNWNYSLVAIKENHEEMLCSKIWNFTKNNVVWWATMPDTPK